MAAERLASAILRARDDRNLCKSSIHKRRRRENFGSNFEIFSSLQWESHTPPQGGGVISRSHGLKHLFQLFGGT